MLNLCLASILLLVLSPSASATSFLPRPFPEAVKDAPMIVRATVGMGYADYGVGSDGVRRIYTFTQFALKEVLKGASVPNGTLVGREMGGEKDGVGVQIPGRAEFARGEDVVVFLSLPANADGSYSIQGMSMGRLNVVLGEDGKERLKGPALSGGGHSHEGGEGHSEPSSRGEWTLADLRNLVVSQGDRPLTEEKPMKNEVTPQSSPSALALQPSPVAAVSERTTQDGKSSADTVTGAANEEGKGILLGVGGILALGALLWFLRKR